MTVLEMTKLCAEAMGYRFTVSQYNGGAQWSVQACITGNYCGWERYEPLLNDSQAMALVKRFRLSIVTVNADEVVVFGRITCGEPPPKVGTDLNCAIVECVAKMRRHAAMEGDPSDSRWDNLPKAGGSEKELRESVRKLNQEVEREIDIYRRHDDEISQA